MPQEQRRLPSFNLWLIIPAICCSLIGCGGTTTTLSIESPGGTHSETETAKEVPSATQVANGPKQEQPPADATSPTTEKNEPASTASSATTALTPKLTMVDPARIVGSWRDSFFGTRTLTLNSDGTAHMRLDFDFAGSLLYGNRLDFDMKWKLEQGVITIDIIDGHPKNAAKSAMSTWGKRYVYLLDHVEENKVEMRDGVQATSYALARLPDDATSSTRE
jgi:hypothetical protein